MDVIFQLLRELNVESLVIKGFENNLTELYRKELINANTPWHNGKRIKYSEIKQLCMDCLQEKYWAKLSSSKIIVSFGSDCSVIIETKLSENTIKKIVDSNELFYMALEYKKPQKVYHHNMGGCTYNSDGYFEKIEELYTLAHDNKKYLIAVIQSGRIVNKEIIYEKFYVEIINKIKNNKNIDFDNLFTINDEEVNTCNENLDKAKKDFIELFNNIFDTNIGLQDLVLSNKTKIIKCFYYNARGRQDNIKIYYRYDGSYKFIYGPKKVLYQCNTLIELLENVITYIKSSKKIKGSPKYFVKKICKKSLL